MRRTIKALMLAGTLLAGRGAAKWHDIAHGWHARWRSSPSSPHPRGPIRGSPPPPLRTFPCRPTTVRPASCFQGRPGTRIRGATTAIAMGAALPGGHPRRRLLHRLQLPGRHALERFRCARHAERQRSTGRGHLTHAEDRDDPGSGLSVDSGPPSGRAQLCAATGPGHPAPAVRYSAAQRSIWPPGRPACSGARIFTVSYLMAVGATSPIDRDPRAVNG